MLTSQVGELRVHLMRYRLRVLQRREFSITSGLAARQFA
jgi:hypothetical protein